MLVIFFWCKGYGFSSSSSVVTLSSISLRQLLLDIGGKQVRRCSVEIRLVSLFFSMYEKIIAVIFAFTVCGKVRYSRGQLGRHQFHSSWSMRFLILIFPKFTSLNQFQTAPMIFMEIMASC